MKLYTYFRSSAAYRVRIALNLKQLVAEMIAIHLQKEGGLNLDMPPSVLGRLTTALAKLNGAGLRSSMAHSAARGRPSAWRWRSMSAKPSRQGRGARRVAWTTW